MATQKQGELFGAFATRVKGLVVDCEYVLNCPHSTPRADAWKTAGPVICGEPDCKGVDFEDAVIRDILLAGIYDDDVRRQVLAEANIHRMPIQRIIDLVQRQESAREDALYKAAPEAAAVSQHKRKQRSGGQQKGGGGGQQPQNQGNKSGPKVRPKEKTCECGEKYFDFAKRRNGKFNEVAYTRCAKCAAKEWKTKPRGQRRAAAVENREEESSDDEVVSPGAYKVAAATHTSYVAIASEDRTHPRLPITVILPSESGPFEVRVAGAVADSGAQVSIFPSRMLKGKTPITFAPSPSRTDIRGADGSSLEVSGAVDTTVSATNPSGELITAKVRFYVVNNVTECYLSCGAMRALRIVNEHFPEAGSSDRHDCSLCTLSAKTTGCECTPRGRPPSTPLQLPFPATTENIPRMKQWLLDRYAASTFNKCTHAPLPEMSGPPMEIHLKEGAVPRNFSNPSTVPMHWHAMVKE